MYQHAPRLSGSAHSWSGGEHPDWPAGLLSELFCFYEFSCVLPHMLCLKVWVVVECSVFNVCGFTEYLQRLLASISLVSCYRHSVANAVQNSAAAYLEVTLANLACGPPPASSHL